MTIGKNREGMLKVLSGCNACHKYASLSLENVAHDTKVLVQDVLADISHELGHGEDVNTDFYVNLVRTCMTCDASSPQIAEYYDANVNDEERKRLYESDKE